MSSFGVDPDRVGQVADQLARTVEQLHIGADRTARALRLAAAGTGGHQLSMACECAARDWGVQIDNLGAAAQALARATASAAAAYTMAEAVARGSFVPAPGWHR